MSDDAATLAPVRADLITDVAAAVPGQRVRLSASRCESCDRPEFPARSQCPACGAPSVVVSLPAQATLAGFTSVLHPPPGARVEVPYHVGVARFANGLAILGQLCVPDDIVPATDMDLETIAIEPFPGALTYAFRIV